MNSLEIILAVFLTAAGVLVATVTTAVCIIRAACEKHDRQLFRAYLDYPQDVEAWLVRGAMDHIKRTFSLDDLRQ